MRLFVAISPPPAALDELDDAVAPLRPAWPRLRWVSQQRWHLTLAFLGEVAEPTLDPLSIRLARAAARHPRQQLRIGHGGAFPSAAKARVVLTHIEAAGESGARPAALAALAASVAAGARRAGAPPPDEGRKYRPHLTLARCREPSNVTDLIKSLGGFAGQDWTATEIHLIKSTTGPTPHYEVLATCPLAARS